MSSPVPHRIRAARHNDAGELLTLQRAAFALEPGHSRELPLRESVEDVEHAIEDPDHEVLVAGVTEDGEWGHRGRLVGAVRVEVVAEVVRLNRVVIAPDLRNRGLGSALLEAVTSYAENRPGVTELELRAEGASSENLALYRRYGFRDRGSEERDGHRAALLTLRLSRAS